MFRHFVDHKGNFACSNTQASSAFSFPFGFSLAASTELMKILLEMQVRWGLNGNAPDQIKESQSTMNRTKF